jgi:CTP:molybdopterin cytidylyltransferase MocA
MNKYYAISESKMKNKKVTTLILAGKRHSDDLSVKFGVSNKSFIQLNGQTLIQRVIEKILQTDCSNKIIVSINSEEEEIFKEQLKDFPQINYQLNEVGSGTVQSTIKALKTLNGEGILLITTADNALLLPEYINAFLHRSFESKNVATIGVINGIECGLIEKYPNIRRTWHKLNPKTWLSGINLFFWDASSFTQEVERTLTRMEQQRKNPLQFGLTVAKDNLSFLMRLILQNSSIEDCSQTLTKTLGMQTTLIPIPFPEACIDIDTEEDYELAKTILESRVKISV